MRRNRKPSKPSQSAKKQLTPSDTPASEQDAERLLRDMSDEQKMLLAQELLVNRHVEKTFSGPIPPPEDFEKYNLTLPGAADRIVSMAEKEQQIWADGQNGILTNDRKRINGAILLGLALVIVAGIATWKGYAVIAILLGMSGVLSSVLRQLLAFFSRKKTGQ